LEEVVMALHMLYKYKTGVNTKLLYGTSRMVATLTGLSVQANKAIVGENAFAHESGIHTRGVTEKPITFEPIKPELVGRTRKLVAGKLAGTRGIKAELEEIGIHPTEEQLKDIVQRVKDLGDKGKMVTDADLIALTSAVMGEVIKEEKIVELCDLAVMTGVKVIPTASVRLVLDGKEYVTAETGVGPVDAVLKAITKLTNSLESIRLNEYRPESNNKTHQQPRKHPTERVPLGSHNRRQQRRRGSRYQGRRRPRQHRFGACSPRRHRDGKRGSHD